MKDTISKIYDELYAPKLTPYELLDNAKLDNYVSVSFSTENGVLIGKTKCYITDNELAEFIYTFDQENKLMSLNFLQQGKKVEIYNRITEIKKLYTSSNLYKEQAI
jgi:predicted nucleic acid-binding protein